MYYEVEYMPGERAEIKSVLLDTKSKKSESIRRVFSAFGLRPSNPSRFHGSPSHQGCFVKIFKFYSGA